MQERRRLDNSAQLFPLIIGKKYNGIFRISVLLKDDVNEEILKTAVEKTLNEIKCFKVKLRKNFFYYYFEQNDNDILINKGLNNKFDLKRNNDYLFRISYYKNKIALDVLHYLCDGGAGKKFLTKILYNYFDLLTNNNSVFINEDEYYCEDSYIKNYDSKEYKFSYKKMLKPYIIKGNLLKDKQVDTTKIDIDLIKLKKITQLKECTVTQYLCALLIYAFKTASIKHVRNDDIIRICIPIDLRDYFHSNTMSNFFSYIYIESKNNDIDLILKDVKEQFNENLQKEKLKHKLQTQVKFGNSKILRIIPIIIKRAIVQLFYWGIAKTSTTILSNLGNIYMEDKYATEIKSFEVKIDPDPTKLIKCAFGTHNNILTFNFSSKIEEKDLEKRFKKIIYDEKINSEE